MSVILVTSFLKAWLPSMFQYRCSVGYVGCLVVIILLDYFFPVRGTSTSSYSLGLSFLVWVLGKTKPRTSHMLGQYFPVEPSLALCCLYEVHTLA